MKFLKKNSLFLAPMSGFTDSVYRQMARQAGADICVSEFVHARALLSNAKKVLEKLEFTEKERPYGIQLFGSDPFELADAASLAEEKFAPDFLDINFGCPAPTAVDAGAGSALLKDTKKMEAIALALAQKLKKTPLTAKIRTGWGAATILPDAAKMLEQSGVQMLTIHGRSKNQGYTGQANWTLIEETASVLKIPVIGNGSAENLSAEFLQNSKCFGFMIGRAAIGNPWIFAEIKAKLENKNFTPPSAADRIAAAIFYIKEIAKKSGSTKIAILRPNILPFLKGFSGFKKARLELCKLKSLDEVLHFLQEISKDF